MNIEINNGIYFENTFYNKDYCEVIVYKMCNKIINMKFLPNETVGIALVRKPEMILLIVSLIRMGVPFVPIDLSFPKERIEYIINNSNIKRIFVNSIDVLDGIYIEKIKINQEDFCGVVYNSGLKLESSISDDAIAYIMYTSGTTGKPKGVEVLRKGLFNLINSIPIMVGLNRRNTILCLTDYTFDIFFVESVLAIHLGMKIILANEDEKNNPRKIASLIEYNSVDVIQVTPSRMQLLYIYDSKLEFLKNVRTIMIGGEALPEVLLKKLNNIKSLNIFNMYGPTETTVWSAVSNLTGKLEVDIGKPIANTEIYILDSDLKEVGEGIQGEICIAGIGVSKGYRNNIEMTENSFVMISGENRIYKTGDLGMKKNGNLYCYGRKDNQIKYHGHRIELEEIDNIILSFEEVDLAITCFCDNNVGDNHIVGFYVSSLEIEYSTFIKKFSDKLPKYMMPHKFIRVPYFLYNNSGKADRSKIKDTFYCLTDEFTVDNKDNSYILKVGNVIKSNTELTNVELTEETKLSDLGIDSLSYLKIIVELEKEFGMEFSDDFLIPENIENIGEIVRYIKSSKKV